MVMNKTLLMILGLLVLVGVIVLVVMLLRKKSGPSGPSGKHNLIKICVNEDHSKEFMNDLKLPGFETFIENFGLSKQNLYNGLYDKNKLNINNVYCDENTRKLFKAFYNNMKRGQFCNEELFLYNILEKFRNYTNDLIKQNKTKSIKVVIALAVTLMYYNRLQKGGVIKTDQEILCSVLLCGDHKSIWLSTKGRGDFGVSNSR